MPTYPARGLRPNYDEVREWNFAGHNPDGTGKQRLQLNGTTLPEQPINVRGSGKATAEFSGITHFFVPSLLDVRAYGAVAFTEAQWAAQSTATRNANRALNNAAFQDATNAAAAATQGTRIVYIPGDFTTVYEFDATILYGNGVNYMTEHMIGNTGPRLHYYGAVDTHAFRQAAAGTAQAQQSSLVFQGVRIEDKRAAAEAVAANKAALVGTGCGVYASYVVNNTIFEECFITGFYRNIYLYNNDMTRIEGGWIGPAHDYGVYHDYPGYFNVIRGVAFDIFAAAAPSQKGAVMVAGGMPHGSVAIENIKMEPDVVTAHGIVLRTGQGVSIRNAALGGGPGGSVQFGDCVRIEAATAGDLPETVRLENIANKFGSVANLLHVLTDTGEDYTIPGTHASQPTRILEWTAQDRKLSTPTQPGGGVYAWTSAASGTTPGTYVMGAGAGTSPTAVAIDGDDMRGSIALTTGTSPQAGQQLISVYFRVTFPKAIKGVILTPANAATAALSGGAQVYPGNLSAGQLGRTYFRLYTGSVALAASTAYRWHYQVLP